MSMLGLIVLGSFFEAYDLSLLTAALKHISEDLRIDERQMGSYLAGVRFGGFFAFALLPLADRVGRRPHVPALAGRHERRDARDRARPDADRVRVAPDG